ncbi:unnamed protein product [Dibothriocephalus latus]|uniref:Uncharacterized protein n=1 Tax=Dibothriocephalus latus TaxID=60516 RepID=A0A3P7LKH8_DIBLA|nr:unnamed protein product [Dibothriocephalus latus]
MDSQNCWPTSLFNTHCLKGHSNTSERLTLETWYSDANYVNRHLDLHAAYKVLRQYVSKGQGMVKSKPGFADEDGPVTKPPEKGAGVPASSTVGTEQTTNCRHAKPKSPRKTRERTEKIDQPKANKCSRNFKLADR